MLLSTGRPAEALSSYETARSVRQSLAASNPEIVRASKRSWRSAEFNIGLTLASIGPPAEALAAYEKAREIWSELVDSNPTVTEISERPGRCPLCRRPYARDPGSRKRTRWRRWRRALCDLAGAGCGQPQGQRVPEPPGQYPDRHRWVQGRDGKASGSDYRCIEQARSIYQKLADANPHVTEFPAHIGVCPVAPGDTFVAEQPESPRRSITTRKRGASNSPLVDDNPSCGRISSPSWRSPWCDRTGCDQSEGRPPKRQKPFAGE